MAIGASGQTPTVTGVENDTWSAPVVNPGSLGYVLGTNLGALESTIVTFDGQQAKVLAVSGNQIHVLVPPNLAKSMARLVVTVDGQASEAIDVIVGDRIPRQQFVGHGSVSARPPPALTLPRIAEPPKPHALPQAGPASSGSGIVYTCDPSVTALSPTACTILNTTIAGLYANAFTNANANIYIQILNSGSLGSSDYSLSNWTYTNFRNALIAGRAGSTDAAAAASVPATNPFPSSLVGIPLPLQAALGLAPDSCMPSSGCYDGTISINGTLPLYFRNGSITSGQYDFFSVVEHETDEILGTASCAVACDFTNTVFPPDFFRYHSNGTRSFGPGTNAGCFSSDATNACLSLDGLHMLQQYNNIAIDGDAGDWVSNCASYLVQDASACPGIGGMDISPSAEILVLDAIGYTLRSASAVGLQFVPVTPCRVADTRNAAGPFGGPSLGAGATRNFTVPSSGCGIPSTALAYSLNMTVVPQGPLGFLATWPAGQAQPVVSTLNSDGRIKANAAIVPAGTNGAISVYASNATDVVLDINGYFVAPASSTLAFYPLTPCRVADTRNPAGPLGGPSMPALTSRNFPVRSSTCGIPSTAQAYSLNMTVVPSGGGPLGYLSTWPTGATQPFVSTLNAPTGAVLANAAIVPAGTGGAIDVFVTNQTDVIIDINGYFAPPGSAGALSLYPVTPCRVVDTRNAAGPFGGPALAGGVSRSFPVPSSTCGIPLGAQAYSLNATIVPSGTVGFLALYGGGSLPGVSTLNDSDASVVANAAIVPAAGDGSVSAYASNPTQLILDINGYFAP